MLTLNESESEVVLMPELCFFGVVCSEFNKEHVVVQSTKWIGKDCRGNAWIIAIGSDIDCNPNWLYCSMHDNCCNLLSSKLKKPCWNRTKEQIT